MNLPLVKQELRKRLPRCCSMSNLKNHWEARFGEALEAAASAGLELNPRDVDNLKKLWRVASLCKKVKSTDGTNERLLAAKSQVLATAEALWQGASVRSRRNESAWFRPENKHYIVGLVPLTRLTLVKYRQDLAEDDQVGCTTGRYGACQSRKIPLMT